MEGSSARRVSAWKVPERQTLAPRFQLTRGPIVDCVQVLREIARRGLEEPSPAELELVRPAIFGLSVGSEVYVGILWALQRMPASRQKEAVRCLFRPSSEGGGLMERRGLLAEQMGVSVRTIIRDEEAGLEQLTTLIGMYADVLELERRDPSPLDSDMEKLIPKPTRSDAEARWKDAQSLIRRAYEVSSEMTAEEKLRFSAAFTKALTGDAD